MPDIFDLIDLGQKADVETSRQRGESASLAVKPTNKVDIDIFDQVARTLQAPDATEAALSAAVSAPSKTPKVEAEPTSSFGERAGQFIKESIGPTAGAYGGAKAGAALGTAFPVLGPITPAVGGMVGAMGGGMLGEYGTQKAGIKPESTGDILTTGATELAFPLAGKTLTSAPVRKAGQAILKRLPGASAILKQEPLAYLRQIPGKFRPQTSSGTLYKELKESGDPFVPMTQAKKMAYELANIEKGMPPTVRKTTTIRTGREAEEIFGTGKPEQLIDTGLIDKSGKAITRTVEALPDTGIPFSKAQEQIKRYGEEIGKAEGGTSSASLLTLRKQRNAMIADIEQIAIQNPKLKAANHTFMQEEAGNDLSSMIEHSWKEVSGKPGIREMDASTLQRKIRLMTDPSNKRDYDALFTKGLGPKQLAEIDKTLNELQKIGKISFSLAGPGSLAIQSALGGLGGAALGGMSGGRFDSTTGAVIGAASPAIISAALLTKPGRAFLLRSMKSSGGRITDPTAFLAALGSVVQRTPTLAEED